MDIQRMPKLKKKEVREKIVFKVEARVFLLIFFLVVFFVGQYFLRRGIISSDMMFYGQPATGESAENSEGQIQAINMPSGSSPSQRELYLGSFGYSFSNVDLTETNLYFDKVSTAIFFPPNYEWRSEAADTEASEYFKTVKFNGFNGPYEDERCLKNNCLSQTGNKIYYNNRALSHPAALRNLDIAAVSLGVLQNRWLVGYTIKTESGYEGRIFYFDGRKFTKIDLPKTLSSSYFGLLGFGGDEQDFLIVYGAYQGLAYRVRGDRAVSLDNFFGFRIMNKGFQPEVIRVESGGDITWYVYSRTLGHPQLVKLWQNGGPDIVGEVALPDLFFGYKSAAFKLQSVSSQSISLIAELTDQAGDKSFKMFVDSGFDNDNEGILTTLPIAHDGGNSEIVIKKIVRGHLYVDDKNRDRAKFLFSTDKLSWRDVPIGENLDFVTPKLKAYFLKVIFPPSKNKFFSPFVNGIAFDYYCQK